MVGTVYIDVDGPIARLVLSNPERRNAIGWSMLCALDEAVVALRDRTDVSVVVLTGDGADFCVGADLAAAPEHRILRRDSVVADTARLRAAAATAAAPPPAPPGDDRRDRRRLRRSRDVPGAGRGSAHRLRPCRPQHGLPGRGRVR